MKPPETPPRFRTAGIFVPPGGAGGGKPTGVLSVQLSNLTFVATGSTKAATFTASETSYTGAYTESDTCSGVATVTAASNTFTVTPSAAGSCTITIADSNKQTATVGVSVTTTSGIIQSRKTSHS